MKFIFWYVIFPRVDLVSLLLMLAELLNLPQLSELVTVEGYSDWIRLVAEFTLKSLHSWKVEWLS